MEYLAAHDYTFSRNLFECLLASIYCISFIVGINQAPALLGENGLLPIPTFLKYVKFKQAPSLFHFHFSDLFLKGLMWSGIIISAGLAMNLSSILPVAVHMLLWAWLYILYLSLSNVGQNFYGFGWESMLCEAGFFMIFMGPSWMTPSWIPIIAIRWMLFRTEMGAGLIKIRGDKCWRDLTALYYHHETQPMPNPLSRYFHHLPKSVLKGGVIFSHFVQLIAPFGLFFPHQVSSIAAVLIILHQLILVAGGNYSWLNWITIILGILAIPMGGNGTASEIPLWFNVMIIFMGIFVLYLSYQPLLNLFAKNQKMNYCWNRYHLVGAYGAFGSVTKKRYEIIIEGSRDGINWLPYEFKAKPGDLKRVPPQYAPYHLRLDWLMWFLPFGVYLQNGMMMVLEHEPWFLRFVQKLLLNDQKTIKLLASNPFPDMAPLYIRASYYHYEFTSTDEKKNSGDIWKRHYIGQYLQQLSLKNFN